MVLGAEWGLRVGHFYMIDGMKYPRQFARQLNRLKSWASPVEKLKGRGGLGLTRGFVRV